MKFSYSNATLYFNLIMGLLWTIIGSSYFFDDAEMRWSHYLFLVIGLLYIAVSIYEYIYKYFEINNGKIKVFSFPAEEIRVSEITELKYDAGAYIFKTAGKTVKIAKSKINKKQLPIFEDYYNNLSKKFSLMSLS